MSSSEKFAFRRKKNWGFPGIPARDVLKLFNDGVHLYGLKQNGEWGKLSFHTFAPGVSPGEFGNFFGNDRITLRHLGHQSRVCNIFLEAPNNCWSIVLDVRPGRCYRVVELEDCFLIYYRTAVMKYLVE